LWRLEAHETLTGVVGIVTDSAANLPSELAGELGIEIVPMYLKFGAEVYRDGFDLTPADFYQRLARDQEPASTSMPSPGDYLEAFERAGQDQIVCVTIASTMSGAHQQAALAAQRFSGHVELVDSRSASMGQGFVALEAARSARSGATFDGVARRAREVAEKTRLFATVDTFEFLRRSGRVTKLQAYAATVLDIKPVFSFSEGDVAPVARPRTRGRALARVVEETVAAIRGRPVHLAAFHAAAEADAQALCARVAERAEVRERIVVEVTPVIGAHTGPGMVGTTFYCDG
jgi:DegV family protein with EDD domain